MKFLAAARRRALTTATIIAFSLTFAVAGVALLLGLLPGDANLLSMGRGSVDAGVVLLMVPLAALVLAMLFEATRLVLRGPIKMREARPAPVLSDWTPGTGEG